MVAWDTQKMPLHEHFRAFGRRPVSLRATLEAPTVGFRGQVHVLDLGLGGAQLEVRAHLAAGSAVRLTVETPNRWEPVVLVGHVVWSHRGSPARAGVRFDHDSGATLRALLDLLGDESYG